MATPIELRSLTAAIRQNAERLAEVDRQIVQLKRAIAGAELDAEALVVFEPEYKNDAQRRIGIANKLQANPVYQSALTSLDELQTQKATIAALLEELRSNLSIAKLEVKLAIASRLGAGSDLLEV